MIVVKYDDNNSISQDFMLMKEEQWSTFHEIRGKLFKNGFEGH